MKLNLKPFYLLGVFVPLIADELFGDMIQMGELIKPVTGLCLLGTVLLFKHFHPFVKAWCLLVTGYVVFEMMESYNEYFTPFVYPHVFQRTLILYCAFFVHGFYRRYPDKIELHNVVWLILIGTAVNLLVFNRQALSLGAFISHDRPLPSASVLLMSLAPVYFFNKYFNTKDTFNLWMFFGTFGLVIFMQHRSVWVSCGFSVALCALLVQKSDYKIDFKSVMNMVWIVTVVGVLMVGFVFTNDKLMAKVQENVEQIANPIKDEESTSAWRYAQTQAYLPYVKEHIWTGMRLKGFELKPLKYGPKTALPFPPNSGHHFHSFYMDKLFYLGAPMFVLLHVLPILWLLIRVIFHTRYLDYRQITLVAYVAGSWVYGISYNIFEGYFGVLGYALFALLQEPQKAPPQAISSQKQTNNALHRHSGVQPLKLH